MKSLQKSLVPSPVSDTRAGGPSTAGLARTAPARWGSSLLLSDVRLAVLPDPDPLAMFTEAHRTVATDAHGRGDCPRCLQALQHELHGGDPLEMTCVEGTPVGNAKQG